MNRFDGIDTRSGIIAWFARNSVAANLLMCIIFAVGLGSALKIPRTVQPDFVLQTIQISVVYPGAAPDEVEKGIVLKIEEALKDIESIKRLDASASESLALVRAEIDENFDVSTALDEIKSAVDGIASFPEEAEKPVIQHLKYPQHAVNIQVWGDLSERDMKSQIEQIKSELLQDPDIGFVRTFGGRDYEISVEVSEATLHKYHLSLGQVANAIRNSSLDLPGGAIKTDNGDIMLRTKGQAYRQRDFERIVLITNPDGTRLTLGDVATIRDAFVESTGFSLFDNDFSMGATVYAVGNQDMIAVADAAKRYVEKKRSQLPEGVNIDYWADITYYLTGRLDMMVKNLVLGAALVFLVLTLFLDIKLAFWVIVGLPVCFLGTFAMIGMEPVSQTLNMISLFGFILVLGIVVDDAIIIGESAGTYIERHGHSADAVIAGAKRVAIPATFGVLTTIVAFFPTLLADGVFAPFPAAFGWVVIFCLTFSLIESKFILPAHLIHSRPSQHGFFYYTHHLQRFCNGLLDRFVNGVYEPLLQKCLRNRYITMAFFVSMLILTGGLVAGGMVRFIMVPSMPNDFITASLEMVEGTAEQQTLVGYRQMARALETVDEQYKAETGSDTGLVRHDFAYAFGGRNVNFMVELTKNEVRSIDSYEVSKRWREAIGDIPGAKVLSVSTATDTGGGQDVQFKLISSNTDQLALASKDFMEHLATYDGLYDFRNSSDAARQEIVMGLKPGAESLGLTLADVATQVRHAFHGAEAQRLQRGNNEIKVMVRYPKEERKAISDLESMYVRTPDGNTVPLSSVASISAEPGFSKLTRINSERAVTVGAAADRSIAEPDSITRIIEQEFMPTLMAKYPGLDFKLDGMSEESDKVMFSLLKGFALALFGVYALLAIPLRSYLQPVIIMGVIPFGIIGAIVGHMVMGLPLGMMSFMGIIALSGVVVNDSLIMVDFINQAVARGEGVRSAVIASGKHRYRAIMLTSLTTFFGLVPMLLETSIQAQILTPMAVSLAFGIIFATVITLLLLPCLYVILEDLKQAAGQGSQELEIAPAQ